MGTDLVLTGTFTLNGTDCSDETTEVVIKGTVADVVVPSTLTKPTSHVGGSNKYELTIGYLSDDASTGIMFPILWAALSTPTKELPFTAMLRAGAIGVGNPMWSGTIVVSGSAVGGDVGGVSTDSITCTMTGAPVPTTA